MQPSYSQLLAVKNPTLFDAVIVSARIKSSFSLVLKVVMKYPMRRYTSIISVQSDTITTNSRKIEPVFNKNG